MCGAMPHHFRLLETDPGFRSRQARLEEMTSHRRAVPANMRRLPLVTIPVVVHVVYDTAAANVSAAQIRSQIRVLNEDFRATNSDRSKVPAPWRGLVTDTRIRFRLATRGPKGEPTTGITRTRTSRTEFSDDDAVKFASRGGHDAWNTKKFLNIWVCNLQPWLGYAQFPGGPMETDGVVVQHTCFGTNGTAAAPFNLGRTTTHEVGHWLNLRHIWADTEDCSGSDFVADTPNAAAPNYGKPTWPKVSCNNGPNGDMFVNYMDYVDDDSMFMFTAQQVVRMRTALDDARAEITRR
jgi:Pregnancy-associated plasma protein-A